MDEGRKAATPAFALPRGIIFLALVSLGMYLIYRRDHTLFVLLSEVFCVVVSGGIFMIAWHARELSENKYLPFVGVGLVFVAGFDILHMLAYRGDPIFGAGGPGLSVQLWIVARYIQAISLLLAPLFVHGRMRPYVVFPAYIVGSILTLTWVFYWNFPRCYTHEGGPTLFAWVSAHLVIFIFLAALFLLYRTRKAFSDDVFQSLAVAVLLMMVSSLAFTLSYRRGQPQDFLGHLLKLLAFYMTYKAIILVGVVDPSKVLFVDLKRNAEGLRRERDFAEGLLLNAQVVILVRDVEGRVLRINPYTEGLSGHTFAELKGQDYFDTFVPGEDRERSREMFREMVRTVQSRTHTERMLKRDGTTLEIEWFDRTLTDRKGEFIGLLSIGQDITQRKLAEQDMRRRAFHDTLTGLANRDLLQDHLDIAIRQCRREGRHFALMILDLDLFKDVNDTYGHATGDDLLRTVANRLANAVRSTDTVARIGGDEFVLLFPEIDDPASAEVLAEKAIECFHEPFTCREHVLDVHASLGIAVYPEDATTAHSLYKRTDIAMYRVKRQSRNGFLRFNPSLLADE